MTTRVALLGLALVACSAPRPSTASDAGPERPLVSVVMAVDPAEFSNRELLAIQRAVTVWDDATGYQVRIRVVRPAWPSLRRYVGVRYGRGCHIVATIAATTSLDPSVGELDLEYGTRVAGFAAHNRCGTSPVRIVTDRAGAGPVLTWIVMHEVGHALGLDHVPAPPHAVMAPRWTPQATCDAKRCCVARVDLEQLCKLHGCDAGVMQACR